MSTKWYEIDERIVQLIGEEPGNSKVVEDWSENPEEVYRVWEINGRLYRETYTLETVEVKLP